MKDILATVAKAKRAHPGMVVLFRIGDFYEAFGEDAHLVAAVCGLTVTKRENEPMAGFMYHNLEAYLRKLIVCGRRVAVCEPVKSP